MFKEAGIDTSGRHITGHSGKATCCTELFSAGFAEETVVKRSGHLSTAVRGYNRSSFEHEKRVSDSLQPPRPKSAPATISVPPKNDDQSTGDTKQQGMNTLTVMVPDCIDKVVIVKGNKRFSLDV